MSDAKEIIELVGDEIRNLLYNKPTHVRIETLGCGEITCPVDHITLHMVGGTHRLLIRDDIEWREISPATYNYLKGMLNYV
jgi:hypothetical protein